MAASQNLLEEDFLRKLERLDLLSRKIHKGGEKGERRSRKKGESVEFADYRHYVQGDEPRFIDWNIFGRLDKLFLKLFLEEEELNVRILLDSSLSMGFEPPSRKIDLGVKIAASIAYITLVRNNRLTITPFSSEPAGGIGPCRGRRMVMRTFEFLNGIAPAGRTGLYDACRRAALESKRKGVLILISDFLDPGGFDEGMRFLVSRNLDVHAIQVLSPVEIKPELKGDLRLVDCELGSFAEVTVSENLLRAYRRTLESFMGSLKAFCTARGINYIFARTDTPFEKTVLEVMRGGGLLG